jgi:hypothetical protein
MEQLQQLLQGAGGGMGAGRPPADITVADK